jgi:hypothetical protein
VAAVGREGEVPRQAPTGAGLGGRYHPRKSNASTNTQEPLMFFDGSEALRRLGKSAINRGAGDSGGAGRENGLERNRTEIL